MTAEAWKSVERQLESPWGSVKLRVDGYDLVLQVQQEAPRHFVIMPYVNGRFLGQWLLHTEAGGWHEEARRFLPVTKRRVFRASRLKCVSKRVADELSRKTFECRGYYWSSFAALKRHLIANNTSIELAEETP